MSTMMVCAKCGGLKISAGTSLGAAGGRRCTCPTSGTHPPGSAAAAAEHSGVAVAVQKRCSVCNADVSDKKRMKDGTSGRYWCYDCYQVEQRKKSAGIAMRCPHCNKDVAPVHMVKHGEQYWCESCDAEFDAKGKKKKPATNTAAPAEKTATKSGFQTINRREVKADASEDGGGGSKKLLIAFVGLAVVVAVLWFSGVISF